MNWRRLLGLDPAGKSGWAVETFRLIGGGEIRGDITLRADDILRGPFRQGVVHHNQTAGQIMRQLMNYHSPDQTGKTLADKDKTRVQHGLHLDDYQPRSHEHGVQRITFERAYPPVQEWQEESWLRQRPNTEWVDYRNRSPLSEGDWVLPPMRDALADLQEHLRMVERKLAEQELVAVEVSIEHEPTPSKSDGSGQGWNFAVHLLAVPQAVLDAERETHAEVLVKLGEQKAEMERRRTAHS